MQELLPYYERELAFLRRHSAEFAQKYPKIAGRLMLSGDVGEDPHVERLIESFALLASRVHKRLDDDFPEITESLLEVLYPHYLRPFPSCSIAKFNPASQAIQLSRAVAVPRHTILNSRAFNGVACRFSTSFEVKLAPVRIVGVHFQGHSNLPEGTVSGITGERVLLSIDMDLTNPQANWSQIDIHSLRVHLDGEASQVAALRTALCHQVDDAYLQCKELGPWQRIPNGTPTQVGFNLDEALLDYDERSHDAYRLITEFFSYPEKFNFVDLPLPVEQIPEGLRRFTIHYSLRNLTSDSNEAALIEATTEKNLILFCVPVINLFEQRADPIRLTHKTSSNPVLPDAQKAYAYEVYSVEKVYRIEQTSQGEKIEEFFPLFSLKHENHQSLSKANEGRYWILRRNEILSELSPGYEYELSIIDNQFNPAQPSLETLSVNVKATNRDLPTRLSISNTGGDLFMEGGSAAKEIRLLRKPTRPFHFEKDKGSLWRLVSHLSLNHLSLSGSGIDALKELLRLYDLPKSSSNRRILDGMKQIEYKPATAYLPGKPYASFVRGMEIRLVVDEQNFIGLGLHLFASVLEHFFGLYVHVNSFIKLTLVSSRTNEDLIQCPPRNGNILLL